MKYIFLSVVFVLNLFASNSDMVFDELLEKVKNGYKTQSLEDKKREKRFLDDLKNQQKLLFQMKENLKKAKALSKKLKKDIKSNELSLQKLSNELELASVDLGELFGTVNQISSDMNVHIKNSLVSSQFPKRKEFLKELSSKRELSNIKELEKLWFIMFQEIVESGKIVKYNSEIITNKSTKSNEPIIRVGNFNAISKDGFLKFNSDKSVFIESNYQTNKEYLSTLNNYFNTNEKIAPMVIDPTKGTILDLISQKPSLEQRIEQGGVIGYIIIVIAIIGLLFALVKYLWLLIISKRIKKQAKDLENIKLDNPLGRIVEAYESNKTKSLGDLEYKVDEAFYKEVPPIQSGFSMLKLFGATAPLLGLLGTVTGMILTFQSITLFGTSDPKLMAGGISQALITTMLGLIAAIPLLFAHTILNSKAKKIINFLEQNSISLIAKKINNDT